MVDKLVADLIGVGSDPEEIKSIEVFNDYWNAKSTGYPGNMTESQFLFMRLMAFNSWDAGRRYEEEKKEQKRNPIFQPKPGDVVGKSGEERKVYIVEERLGPLGRSGISVSWKVFESLVGECTLQEWQSWAKDADLIRRRKK